MAIVFYIGIHLTSWVESICVLGLGVLSSVHDSIHSEGHYPTAKPCIVGKTEHLDHFFRGSLELLRCSDIRPTTMKLFNTLSLLTFTCVSSQNISTSFVGGSCPGDGFDSLNEFDFGEFISARWYSIQQKETWYLPTSQFYCVYAEYEPADVCPFCFGRPKVTVFHRSLRNSVTGSERTVDFRAVVPFPDRHPARAYVGRKFVPLALFASTNLWIIDAGTYDDVINNVPSPSGAPYEWALVTAGRPNREGENGTCFTRGGMWIIARDPQPTQAVIDATRARADTLGLDVSQLLPVQYAGCVYN